MIVVSKFSLLAFSVSGRTIERSQFSSGPVTMVTLGLGVADSARGITSTSVFNQHLHNGRIHEVRRMSGHDNDDYVGDGDDDVGDDDGDGDGDDDVGDDDYGVDDDDDDDAECDDGDDQNFITRLTNYSKALIGPLRPAVAYSV